MLTKFLLLLLLSLMQSDGSMPVSDVEIAALIDSALPQDQIIDTFVCGDPDSAKMAAVAYREGGDFGFHVVSQWLMEQDQNGKSRCDQLPVDLNELTSADIGAALVMGRPYGVEIALVVAIPVSPTEIVWAMISVKGVRTEEKKFPK